ncbi:MAG: serine-aspartate repeat-containing protein [Phycisphaerales bacterium]|jgi:hypothetical protein|nr:serine-aspartate repeat-containing protein [Phycisphaerales bacterium]
MNRSVSSRSTCTFESLERRALLAATISGAVMQDMSGNGLSSDDRPLSGIVVKLYKDLNANGKLDASDGAAISSKTTGALGVFAFTGLSTGKYLVQDNPGANQVRTAPDLTNVIGVNVTNTNGVYTNNVFANYVKSFDKTALSNITYTINGKTTVTTLTGNVKEGDKVTVNFTVAAGKTVELSLVAYKATAPFSSATNLKDQTLSDLATGKFTAGRHCLTVTVPKCYFQVDFVGGKAINPFGPAGSNILYGAQDRLIAFVNGGTKSCNCEIPPVKPPCEPPVKPPTCEPKGKDKCDKDKKDKDDCEKDKKEKEKCDKEKQDKEKCEKEKREKEKCDKEKKDKDDCGKDKKEKKPKNKC